MEEVIKYKKPDPIELRQKLQSMPGWVVVGERLEKIFRLQNFARAMVFVNKIVNPVAEQQNYPKITITYDRVLVSLFTNEAGGITFMDLDMAREMDALAGVPPPVPKEDLLKV